MSLTVQLERPELFEKFYFQRAARRLRKLLLEQARRAAADLSYQPNIAVVVRTKNDRLNLERWIKHIESIRHSYKGRIDLIVVDTESTNGTTELAKTAGATLVDLKQKDFSYPKSINLGLDKVAPDVEAVFISVGHAQPAVNICLPAAARHFRDLDVAAVYCDQLPHQNASWGEQALYLRSRHIHRRLKTGVHQAVKPHGGIMQATGCMVRMADWREHPFDEAFARGGEDIAWARWALSKGKSLIYEPAAIVHHSHGLGPINLLRELRYWLFIYFRPGEFNRRKIAKYRPDLFDE